MVPELVVDCRCQTGEGPLWHPDERRLYWVDIPAGRLYCWDPATGHHNVCFEGEPIGGFTVQDDGALLLLQKRGAVRTWRQGQLMTILAEIPEERNTRFNDAVADPEGRVFAGTMPATDHASRLYVLRDGSAPELLVDGAAESNGMDFSPDLRRLYWTDTHRRTIYVFDYEQETGHIHNQRPFARVPDDPDEGIPDGLTVDADGGVWSARWDGGCVVRYSPEGRGTDRIRLPVRQVSSVIFGGEEYADLYITTSGGDDRRRHGEGAGALFRVTPGVRGRAPFRSRVRSLQSPAKP